MLQYKICAIKMKAQIKQVSGIVHKRDQTTTYSINSKTEVPKMPYSHFMAIGHFLLSIVYQITKFRVGDAVRLPAYSPGSTFRQLPNSNFRSRYSLP